MLLISLVIVERLIVPPEVVPEAFMLELKVVMPVRATTVIASAVIVWDGLDELKVGFVIAPSVSIGAISLPSPFVLKLIVSVLKLK